MDIACFVCEALCQPKGVVALSVKCCETLCLYTGSGCFVCENPVRPGACPQGVVALSVRSRVCPQGVEFEQQHVNISDEYKAMYDAAAAVWLQVREAIEHCKDGLQILDGRAHKVGYRVHQMTLQVYSHDIWYSLMQSVSDIAMFHALPVS